MRAGRALRLRLRLWTSVSGLFATHKFSWAFHTPRPERVGSFHIVMTINEYGLQRSGRVVQIMNRRVSDAIDR